jgi:hypothetical protein
MDRPLESASCLYEVSAALNACFGLGKQQVSNALHLLHSDGIKIEPDSAMRLEECRLMGTDIPERRV